MRRLFTLISALSLLVVLVVLVLMVVSFDRGGSYCWVNTDHARVQAVFYFDDNVGYFRSTEDYVIAKPGRHFSNSFLPTIYPAGWGRGVPMGNPTDAPTAKFLGLIWTKSSLPVKDYRASAITEIKDTKLIVPLWMVLLLFSAAPALRLWMYWRARARKLLFKRGACTACGYDLAGNVSGVCPECGTARIPAPAQ